MMTVDPGTIIDPVIQNKGLKDDIVEELQKLGTCKLCILRYLGVKDPWVYRAEEAIIDKILAPKKDLSTELAVVVEGDENGPKAKISRKLPCSVCLGLLEEGVKEDFLNQIVEGIRKAEAESMSYSPNLTMPVSIQIRSYAMWFHLCDKFSQVYNYALNCTKPEGIALKAVWKYICTDILKRKINPKSEWTTEGSLVINIFLQYSADDKECIPLLKIVPKGKKNADVSRVATENLFSSIKSDGFRKHFPSPPTAPDNSLRLNKIVCSHMSMYLAGRYCKYSRDVSQSPWLNPDGSRVRGLGSVQEFIAEQVNPMFKCEQIRFSASGREDTDVRMLGKGRPFVVEIVNPKKTIFTPDKIQQLKQKINESTDFISVRDLQLVDKNELSHLKEGEENKTKIYCALCQTTGKEVTPEMLQILNSTSMPLVLHQTTPIRVLHRRNLDVRLRKILTMSAVPAKKSKEMFILNVQTEAGTYVKEFVHGDMGRTVPSVCDLLGVKTEILSLDVSAVELNWPPVIDE